MNSTSKLRVLDVSSAPNLTRDCAALPWRIDSSGRFEVLLVSDHDLSRWSIPSARLERSPHPRRIAERAAFRQAGVTGRISPRPMADILLPVASDGDAGYRNMTVFGLHVLGSLVSWHQERKIARRWWQLQDAAEGTEEPWLSRLLSSLARDNTTPEKKTRLHGLQPLTAHGQGRSQAHMGTL